MLLELPEGIVAELADTSIIAPHSRFYAVASDAVLENTAALIKAAHLRDKERDAGLADEIRN